MHNKLRMYHQQFKLLILEKPNSYYMHRYRFAATAYSCLSDHAKWDILGFASQDNISNFVFMQIFR